MQRIATALPDVWVLEPRWFTDARGGFMESFNQRTFDALIGEGFSFVQDNHSCSRRGVLRGLHYQVQSPQGKLVRAVSGEIFDVAVDLRPGSAAFGRWVSVILSASNRRQLWIPPGFAHGFLALSDNVEVEYKVTDYYAPAHERTLRWDDPDLAIDWPLDGQSPILSPKDADGLSWRQVAGGGRA